MRRRTHRPPRRAPAIAAAFVLAALAACASPRAAAAPDPEAAYAEARARWLAAPRDEEAIVWYGRRAAYLGRYEEAVGIYTDGLLAHPDSVALLRHRGHRLITLRRHAEAVADLARASALARGRADEIEPDGMPNPAGIPRSTLHGNVEYHLALALDLLGRRAEAEAAWRRALALSTNDDTLCAVTNWLRLNLLAQRRPAEADALLAPVREDMEILENHAYHALLLYDLGLRGEDGVLHGHEPGSVEHATRAYGLAARLAAHGERARAAELARTVVARDAPAAFGTIAAEALLAELAAASR